jgi:cobalt-zinc-cadmium efflux system protein
MNSNGRGYAHEVEVVGLAATRRLTLALVVTLAFVGVEAAAGVLANSLALLTDAAHNLTDVFALGLSWVALRLAARPATAGRTFGYHRAGILVALFNSATLVVVALGIFWEAYRRLLAPPPVQQGLMIVVAAVAFGVNLGTALLVRRGSQHDLNLRSAFVHLAGDAISTLGAVLAGVGIALTGWRALDPLVSILIGLLIVYNAWGVVREAVSILLESTPHDVNVGAMVADIADVEGVRGLHDLHVWSINQRMRALSAHVLVDDVLLSRGAAIRGQIAGLLRDKYGIAHATLQLECADCGPGSLHCDLCCDLEADPRDNGH